MVVNVPHVAEVLGRSARAAAAARRPRRAPARATPDTAIDED